MPYAALLDSRICWPEYVARLLQLKTQHREHVSQASEVFAGTQALLLDLLQSFGPQLNVALQSIRYWASVAQGP